MGDLGCAEGVGHNLADGFQFTHGVLRVKHYVVDLEREGGRGREGEKGSVKQGSFTRVYLLFDEVDS